MYNKTRNANDLCQQHILQNGLIKFDKLNAILPMTHIEYAHPRLVAQRKLIIAKKTNETNHNQESRKKWSMPTRCAITMLFGAKNVSKKCNEAHQQSLKDLVLYIYNGYRPFPDVKIFGYGKLIL